MRGKFSRLRTPGQSLRQMAVSFGVSLLKSDRKCLSRKLDSRKNNVLAGDIASGNTVHYTIFTVCVCVWGGVSDAVGPINIVLKGHEVLLDLKQAFHPQTYMLIRLL